MLYMSSMVLYEDEHLLALNKPPKIPVHKTLDPGREHLLRSFEEAEVFLINRLDKDTSGVVLVAKKSEVATLFAKLFAENRIEKTYFAIVEGEIDFEEKTVFNHIAPIRGLKNIYGSVKSGGKRAETKFKKISATSNFSLIKAYPKTGRTHQIRVHLAELGFPIAGDKSYGAQFRYQVRRGMLHAYSLSFIHPLNKKNIIITSPIPDDFSETAQFLNLSKPQV
jgi:RluA family pseudouridine synthase